MQSWDLLAIDTPDGTRDPVVLHSSDGESRAVLIRLGAGQELGRHQVKERAWVCVVEGNVHVEAGGETSDAGVGALFTFDPDEPHAIRSDEGARVLLLLAPWPGAGHYRGGRSATA